MTMDNQQLRIDLQKLHGELQAIESLDEEEQKLLRLLESDIEELLGRRDDNLKPDHDAGERFREGLARLEASHPRVTLLMREIVDSLAYLGI